MFYCHRKASVGGRMASTVFTASEVLHIHWMMDSKWTKNMLLNESDRMATYLCCHYFVISVRIHQIERYWLGSYSLSGSFYQKRRICLSFECDKLPWNVAYGKQIIIIINKLQPLWYVIVMWWYFKSKGCDFEFQILQE